jgi:hypothetical protein
MAVKITTLNTGLGSKEVRFADGTPEERDVLANAVLPLLKKGFALLLEQGKETHKVIGYDPKKHEWKLAPEKPKSKKPTTVSAKDTVVAAVAPVAGG